MKTNKRKITDCQESKALLTEHLLEDLGNSETSRKLLAKLSWTELSHLALKLTNLNPLCIPSFCRDIPYETALKYWDKTEKKCPKCNGTGNIEVETDVWYNCEDCGGDGIYK